MVKGTSRRVIVVDSPDAELFEQAIFIVRSDLASERGVSAQMLVDEACRVAKSCTRGKMKRRRTLAPLSWRASPVFWSLLGALGVGAAWLTAALV
ncbi:MAG: hypothetical protein E7422_03825 [Ruminococcaceae bacterium]|nr:hypothetical protein [Oscillospiraceae bacterium]